MRKVIFLTLLLANLSGCGLITDSDSKATGDYASCVAKVRQDYPVPPGNINAQNQMIANDCAGKK
jgi:uncharacterized protein YceK